MSLSAYTEPQPNSLYILETCRASWYVKLHSTIRVTTDSGHSTVEWNGLVTDLRRWEVPCPQMLYFQRCCCELQFWSIKAWCLKKETKIYRLLNDSPNVFIIIRLYFIYAITDVASYSWITMPYGLYSSAVLSKIAKVPYSLRDTRTFGY